MLHDIGVFVSYARHHKHSAYLIANADIPGLTEMEKALASNVARYHRRAHPRDRHPEFVILQPEHRDLVRKLAAIVRVADGLDRTHDGRVRGISLRTGKDNIVVSVESTKDLELELWAVRQKSTLFKEAFGVDLLFRSATHTKTGKIEARAGAPKRASKRS
jgi:exopolyphosphatase/guanosine-5'-triphosphate,3'-diphosphate pyrophosphatase